MRLCSQHFHQANNIWCCFTCFCLKHLFNVYYRVTLKSWPAALQLMPEWNLGNVVTFPMWHITAFLHLETRESTSELRLGAILYSRIKEKYKNAKNMVLKRSQKNNLFIIKEQEWGGRGSDCSASAGNMCRGWLKIFATRHFCTFSANDQRSASCISVWGYK